MRSPTATIPFVNTYSRLPAHFHARVNPTRVSEPSLIKLNIPLALTLGLDPEVFSSPEGVAILSGNRIAEGSEPLALAYAGHQFGHFVPQLGDGRANLLGEVVALDGKRYDLQLKGSGPTPFSRRGDGRAALGPVLREYLVSEAMHALGVPTTRALAAVLTGEQVYRETPQPGAVFTRVASSHLRVGTFQYFAARKDTEALRTLAAYAIERHYPEAAASDRPIYSLLESVVTGQAKLLAQWILLGFVHGVMNTDNTSISGETIDYGPCAFMEAYDPHTVFSSIDHQGRYAYSNQPHAMHWNLTRLAEALLPLLAEESGSDDAGLASAYEALATFATTYDTARLLGLRRKLGILTEQADDLTLAEDLLTLMAANQADFTLTFRHLSAASPDQTTRTLFTDPTAYDSWATTWHTRLQQESNSPEERAAVMQAANPAFIPRNHLVHAALLAAEQNDFKPFADLLNVLARPYDDQPDFASYAVPAQPQERVTQTFCGT